MSQGQTSPAAHRNELPEFETGINRGEMERLGCSSIGQASDTRIHTGEQIMTVAKVNSGLMAAGAAYKAFEASACRNSASDLAELMRLQDDLTALRNQLSSLNSTIQGQISALSKE